MALPLPPDVVSAEAANLVPSQSSGPAGEEPTVQTLASQLIHAESETSAFLESSDLNNAESSVEFLKDLSRKAEADGSTSPESSGDIRKESTVEHLRGRSENTETDTSVSAESPDLKEKVTDSEQIENGLTDAEMDFLISESSRRSKKEPSGEYLESLSRSLLDVCLNLKDHQHPIIQTHQSVDFRNKHDALPKASTRDSHHENLQKHLAEQRNFHIEIHNTSSEVDDSRGRATVYLWYEITGLAQGLEREAVAVLSWERKQGTWMLMKHIGMRGPAGFC